MFAMRELAARSLTIFSTLFGSPLHAGVSVKEIFLIYEM